MWSPTMAQPLVRMLCHRVRHGHRLADLVVSDGCAEASTSWAMCWLTCIALILGCELPCDETAGPIKMHTYFTTS